MGKVYLVGAGPGDAKLITVRGLELIQEADTILYDRLVDPELLRNAKNGAELIYCGKAPGNHSIPQDQINRILVSKAKEGKQVVRLKGGDPFVFGRGGEEAEACVRAGIGFEVVPGVTSGIAAPAYAGIPVTHREYGSSFAVVAGHGSGKKELEPDWVKLAGAVDTLVIYMGIAKLGSICQGLLEAGLLSHTPVALVQQGTRQEQKTVSGTLQDIEEKAREEKVTSPAMIVIGKVVSLREQLSWFEQKDKTEQLNAEALRGNRNGLCS